MGAYSTLIITRSKAKEFIVDKVMNGLSDEELESLMDGFLYDRLYNCMIIPDNLVEEVEHDDHVI